MNGKPRMVTEAQQAFTFTRRATVLGLGQAGVGALLAARMGWLAVHENAHYQTLSESNRVNMTLVPPRRGWLIDRNGKPIADNRTDFRVDIIPDRLEDKDRVLGILSNILSLDDEARARIETDLKRSAGFQPVQVAENLDWEHFAAVSVRLPELPGVAPTRGFARNYPLGAAVGHLVGYVGTANAEQFEKEKDPLLVTPGFKLGKEGLEKTLEKRLRGEAGAKRVEVTARGRLVRELATRPDKPGETVRLTIDAGLQEYAARRMGPSSGSAVVLDALTGDILAMVSMPSFDPNSFSDGISQSEWKMLSEDDHIPLMNKVLQGLYPPGSTVKPMHALACLKAGVGAHETVHCSGAMKIGNGTFHCWRRGGHGAVDLRRAVAQSCDIYFYTMARNLGYDAFAPTVRQMGLGAKYDLPFSSQRYGTVPDSQWKQKKYHKAWTIADSVNASIGQGYVLANPLQLAVMAARLARGRAVVPRLLLDQPHAPAPELGLDPAHLSTIHDAMWAVVNDGGTAGSARLYLPNVDLSGKTGTAQVRRISMAERRGGVLGDHALPFKLRDHSLFVGFAPSDIPRYAVSVVLEHSGHITTAAPIAGDIIRYLFDRDKAIAKLAALEPGWGGDIEERIATKTAEFKAAQAAPPPPAPEDVPAATDHVVARAQAADQPERNVADTGSRDPAQ